MRIESRMDAHDCSQMTNNIHYNNATSLLNDCNQPMARGSSVFSVDDETGALSEVIFLEFSVGFLCSSWFNCACDNSTQRQKHLRPTHKPNPLIVIFVESHTFYKVAIAIIDLSICHQIIRHAADMRLGISIIVTQPCSG